MGKFSYKKKKGTKKQSFKNRKKIGKVGGGDDGDGESKTENANVTTNTTEPTTEPSTKPSTEPSTENATENATTDADAVTTNTPDNDSGYKEFLESLKTDPNLITKTVYLWTSLEKMFIWNDETKKWEDKRNELIEEGTGEDKVEENEKKVEENRE